MSSEELRELYPAIFHVLDQWGLKVDVKPILDQNWLAFQITVFPIGWDENMEDFNVLQVSEISEDIMKEIAEFLIDGIQMIRNHTPCNGKNIDRLLQQAYGNKLKSIGKGHYLKYKELFEEVEEEGRPRFKMRVSIINSEYNTPVFQQVYLMTPYVYPSINDDVLNAVIKLQTGKEHSSIH